MSTETKILTDAQCLAIGAFGQSPLKRLDHARAIERAVLNSPEVVAMRWRPIETAPKDGTEILAFCPKAGTHCVFWESGYWREKASFLGLRNEPTHWIPLPAPPADDAMQEQKP